MTYDVKDLSLAPRGRMQIEWAERKMDVLRAIRKRFEAERPLDGVRMAACLHVTTETANLMRTLKAGGAHVRLCASNPLSTQDDVAASLVEDYGIEVFAIRAEDRDTYYHHIASCLDLKPQVTMDDGADLVSTIHKERSDLVADILGGTEETTTGVIRLRSLAAEEKLQYPIIAVNDARTKHFFDNRYGTGQSTVDGILRATNILFSGSICVVCGYGWCGRGIAMRARGMGARVVVCEVDPLKALEAIMDGYEVLPLKEIASRGDLFVTSTGDRDVIAQEHFEVMKDGAIVANAGHFNVEIDLPALERMSTDRRTLRAVIDEYVLADGRRIDVLAEGRLVNLAAAEGHPSVVMDMSFANQALSSEYLVHEKGRLAVGVYPVPDAIDTRVAARKLETMGIKIDTLTEAQKEYLRSWTVGT